MRRKQPSAADRLREADERVQTIKRRLRVVTQGDSPLAVERDSAAEALRRALAAESLGEASAGDVDQARARVAANAALIAEYIETVRGLEEAVTRAEADAGAVLANNLAAYIDELTAEGLALHDREQQAHAELAAVEAERRELGSRWQRVERAQGHGNDYAPSNRTVYEFGADGRPRQIATNDVVTTKEAKALV
jgi:hypothetical protein